MTKKIDEPLEQLAALKTDDWPFYAVFQKGLMRATAIAWKQFSVVGGTKDSTVEQFVEKWVAFLDELWDRKLLSLKANLKKDKDQVWVGILLNTASGSVRWSDSAVQRIAAMLVLWWYFYTTQKSQVSPFLKKVTSARGNAEYPKGKDLARAIANGLKGVVVRWEEETDEDLDKRVERRLKDLILLGKNKAAAEEEQKEDENEEEGALVETLTADESPAEEAGAGGGTKSS
jgi:hypothetical protein